MPITASSVSCGAAWLGLLLLAGCGAQRGGGDAAALAVEALEVTIDPGSGEAVAPLVTLAALDAHGEFAVHAIDRHETIDFTGRASPDPARPGRYLIVCRYARSAGEVTMALDSSISAALGQTELVGKSTWRQEERLVHITIDAGLMERYRRRQAQKFGDPVVR